MASALAKAQGGLAQELREHVRVVEPAVLRHQALLAAMHYSRHVAASWGLRPWVALMQQRRQAEQCAMRHRQARLIARVWAALSQQRAAGARRDVAAEAAAHGRARQHHAQQLLRQGLCGLAEAALAGRRARQHGAVSVLRHALQRWRAATQCALDAERSMLRAADAHGARKALRAALAGWQRGAREARQQRLLQARREARWASVQAYLQQHRALRAAAAAPG